MGAVIFWVSGALIIFAYAGYPLFITLIAQLGRRSPVQKPHPRSQPSVTVVVVTHNESARVARRVENFLASEYPPEKLSVIVVSDGSTDDTTDRIRTLGEPRVRVLQLAGRKGKPAGVNAGVAASDSELIVFADARQTFAPDAIAMLASRFDNPRVGAVSGELEIAPSQSSTGAGVDAYWKLERFLRAKEAEWDSCIGCTGACYAIRRELFTPLPGDTILDDVIVPMRIIIAGHRVLHEPAARAFDPQPLEPAAETRRKRRTLAGNFQMLFRHPSWLLPWKNRLWWQLAAHKYLRLTGPLLLVSALGSSAVLAAHPFYRTALLLQAAFYLLGGLGMAVPSKIRILSIPAGFLFLNLMVARAFWHYLTNADPARWEARP